MPDHSADSKKNLEEQIGPIVPLHQNQNELCHLHDKKAI